MSELNFCFNYTKKFARKDQDDLIVSTPNNCPRPSCWIVLKVLWIPITLMRPDADPDPACYFEADLQIDAYHFDADATPSLEPFRKNAQLSYP
jgi:hypothetical protein